MTTSLQAENESEPAARESSADAYRVGVDLGGTKTESILLDPAGTEVFRERRPTPAAGGYDAILDNLCDQIVTAMAKAPAEWPFKVGIGIPGSVDANSGLVRNANTTLMIGKPIGQDIESRLGRRVHLENDANCFTLAEAQAGAGRGHELVFGVIMGTGCGGGIALRPTSKAPALVRAGPHGIAGEWGHMSIDPAGPECFCGNRGCIETLISGSGMENAFAARYSRRLRMQEIVDGARAGEADCKAAFDAFLDDFGRALGGLISILDPDVVVLGGGLSNIVELYDRGLERVHHYTFHELPAIKVVKNELGDSAGVIGAAWVGV